MAQYGPALSTTAGVRYSASRMRPLEAEHRGWKIRVIASSAGRAWSALVEVRAPGSDDAAEPTVVPFSGTHSTEKLAQSAGRDAAMRFIDREEKKG